jgi:Protein of unknown function (DUF1559)
MPSQSLQKMMMSVVATAVCFTIITPVGRWIALQRGLGRLAGCESNMKNTALGLMGYLTIKGSFPSGTVPGANFPPEHRLSFYVPVSPYFDECGLIDYIADIKDGTSVTMMLAESGRGIGSWSRGGPATVRGLDPTDVPYIGAGRQFGGLHDGVAVVAMADGSVRTVSETITPKVFEAMSTIAGGEKVTVP